MKILLIRPRPPKETIGLQHVMICEPLELEYLAGNIDPSLAEVRILDMILERGSIDRFVREYQPDIVGLTGYITHIGVVKEYASRVKKNIAQRSDGGRRRTCGSRARGFCRQKY